jgi:hypothetical protein
MPITTPRFQEAATGLTVSIEADPPTPDGKLTLNAIWLDGTNILFAKPGDDFDDVLFSMGRSREFGFQSSASPFQSKWSFRSAF